MSAEAPSPPTTLVVLLGASEWPFSPEFQRSEAFDNSARGIIEYCLLPSAFGLPRDNLLNLFDSDKSADDIDIEIEQFLAERISRMKEIGPAARDLLVYFVGHGGFAGDNEYYLAIRRTRASNPAASSILVTALARTLKENARFLRRIVILDCCFAASAFRAFQSAPTQAAIRQTLDAFEVPGVGVGFPVRGTSLLCSSRHNKPSLLLPDGSATMFSKALLEALCTGSPYLLSPLSLYDVARLAEDFLHTLSTRDAPRPEVHSPDQSEGDIARLPFFPNPASPSNAEPADMHSNITANQLISSISSTISENTSSMPVTHSKMRGSLVGGVRAIQKSMRMLVGHPRLLGLVGLGLVLLLVIIVEILRAAAPEVVSAMEKHLGLTYQILYYSIVVTFGMGFLLMGLAWVLALVKTAQQGRWEWFFILFFFSIMALPFYIIAGPKTSSRYTLGYLFRKWGFTGVKITIERKENER